MKKCNEILIVEPASNTFSRPNLVHSYFFVQKYIVQITLIFISTFGLFPIVGTAQCIEPVLNAGLYCDDNNPEGAPVICSLECLDDFGATMPSTLLPEQPTFLCGNVGTPNNLSWFAFVAGDTLVDITITPSNCLPGSVFSGNPADNLIGIQSGVYSSCGFTEDEVVVCYNDCWDAPGAPVNLVSGEYIEGQIYYLFVDGCGGSVCDYTVTVNSAQQAFEMPEITTITNEFNLDLETDTICLGANVDFRLDSLDLDVNFNWSISPPTIDYPTGVHPITDTNTVNFVFSEEGTFDIIVYAFNECDANEPDTFQVFVAPIEDEVFSDVVLCEECLLDGITLISPDAGCIIGNGVPLILTENPNGDDVPGWQGLSEVTSPGLLTNIVKNTFGCEYTQSVNIVEIPIKPREEIDVYFCFSEFPKNWNGVIFDAPDDFQNITIENGAVSGCDSFLLVNAKAIDLSGIGSVGNCANGMVIIDFDIISVAPIDYDSITYQWLDESGTEVFDADNIDAELQVVTPGIYSVEVTVYKDESECSQLFGTYNVDANSIIPQIPMIAFAPNEICINEGVAQIYVNSQGEDEIYTWNISPVLPFTISDNSDTVFVDVSGGQDFQYCVTATNGCGVSDPFCDDIVVSSVPSSIFSMPSEVCLDSTLFVEYIGNSGTTSTSEFTWSFDGGDIINGASPLSAGPFELQFSSAGSFDISLYLTELGCQSPKETQSIEVIEPFVVPLIECFGLTGAVSFSFDDTFINEFDVSVSTGQSFEIIGTDSIVVGNLGPEEAVNIEILFNDDFICGGQLVQSNCSSLPCPDLLFDLLLSNQDQCIEQDENSILLDVKFYGEDSGSGRWMSPFIVDGNTFNVIDAGVGNHPITYMYEVAGCFFSRDTVINIKASPLLDFDIEYTYCDDNTVAILHIDIDGYTLIVDGVEQLDTNRVEIYATGSHTIMLTNDDGCSTIEEIDLQPEEIDPSFIDGELEMILGNELPYKTNDLGDLPNIAYTWTLDGEIICNNCLEVDIDPIEDAELCMLVTYADSCMQEVCIDIMVVIETEVFVPNIFSPNGDGINDYFKFQSNREDLMIESINIFDRWGALMFEASGSINNEDAIMWDGTFNGSPCNNGVYIYVIKHRDINGNMVDKAGDVTIVR